jgi:ribonuclease BN (tRNA processing enzyme)
MRGRAVRPLHVAVGDVLDGSVRWFVHKIVLHRRLRLAITFCYGRRARRGSARDVVNEMHNAGPLDELMARVDGTGWRRRASGFLQEMVKAVMERGLEAERTAHLGYATGGPASGGHFSRRAPGYSPGNRRSALPLARSTCRCACWLPCSIRRAWEVGVDLKRRGLLRRRAFLAGSVGAAAAATGLVGAGCTAPGQQQATPAPTSPPGPSPAPTAQAPAVPATGTHVVTLGTAAGPAVRSPRQGIATAVVVDGDVYLVDAGLGVVRQIAEARLPMNRLRAVLLTHLHSDHVSELPAVFLYNWGPQVGGFVEPFRVIGPGPAGALPSGAATVVDPATPGTADLVGDVLAAYAYDINIRVYDEARPPLDELVQAVDIALPTGVPASAQGELSPGMEPFEIYRDDKVRILASLVDHPPVFPSYGFRFETPHGVIALSGDTAEHPNVAGLGRGAGMLVHEAVYLDFYRGQNLPPAFINHLAESHTEPAGTGRIAATAGASQLVLSHLAGVASDEQWANPARQHYAGPVTVASDGQVFSL